MGLRRHYLVVVVSTNLPGHTLQVYRLGIIVQTLIEDRVDN